MIRIDAVWLAVEPLDMRVGTEAALARVVNVFGAAKPHHAYLFANRRANRPPRQNSCRPDKSKTGGGDEGREWLGTDKHSRTRL